MTKPYRIGYCRTSTKAQDLGIQRDALSRIRCDRIFEEQESGAKRDRPKLAEALAMLRPGDVFTVWKVDRLARSLSHLLAVVEDLKSRGIHFQSLTENFDTTTASGEAFFQICGVMAQLERKLIEERREAGIQKARDAGKQFGRKPLSDPEAKGGKAGKLAMAIRAVERGSSISAASREFGIARSTIRRHIAIDMSQKENAIDMSRKPARNGHLNGSNHQLAEMR